MAGGGGGAKESCFIERADNLFSFSTIKVIDLLGEGEWEGFATSDPLESIFLDGIPIKSNGKANFPKAAIAFRNGTNNQDPIVSNISARSIPVGKPLFRNAGEAELGGDLSGDNDSEGVSHAIRNTNVTSVTVGIRALSLKEQVIDENGTEIKGRSVQFSIYVNGEKKQTNTIEGKSTNGYVREYTVDLGATVELNGEAVVTIKRDSPDFYGSTRADQINWDYVVEIVEGNLNYPNTVVSSIEVDSRVFTRLPSRSYHVKMTKIKLPSNYNPTTRTYSGDWDGTFSSAQWSNNPAWILYDLITNTRYGLGEFVNEANIDKWKLYEISQYCDELIDDGKNGKEPRFTCNILIRKRSEAIELINQLTTVFRGLPVWSSNFLTFSQDSPRNSIMQFTNSNISEKGFSYTSSNSNQRYSVALVYYNNPNNHFSREPVYVEDADAIKRIGYKQIEIDAFGVTSAGQATRVGRWAIFSTFYESELVTFETSYDALYLTVGEVFQVIDNDRFLSRNGGRLSAISSDGKTITLDSQIYLDPSKTTTIHLTIPQGNLSLDDINIFSEYANLKPNQIQTRTVDLSNVTVAQTTNTLVLDSSVDIQNLDAKNVIWLSESTAFNSEDFFYDDQERFNEVLTSMKNNFGSHLKAVDLYAATPKKYRCVSIKEVKNGVFEIVGLEYNETKYDAVEKGLFIDENSAISPEEELNLFLLPPQGLIASRVFDSTTQKTTVNLNWSHTSDLTRFPNQLEYEISYINFEISTTEIVAGTTSDSSFSVTALDEGLYTFIVKAKIATPLTESNPATIQVTVGTIWQGEKPWDTTGSAQDPSGATDLQITNLQLAQTNLNNTGYFNASPIFSWTVNNHQFDSFIKHYLVEVYSGSTLLNTHISSGNTYQYTNAQNILDGNGQPNRNFSVRVGMEDVYGQKSGYSSTLEVNNEAPRKIVENVDYTINTTINGFVFDQPEFTFDTLQASSPGDDYYDVAGTFVYYSTGSFDSSNITASGIPDNTGIQYIVTNSPENSIVFPVKANTDYYIAAANYDLFGKWNLNISTPTVHKTFGTSQTPLDAPTGISVSSEAVTGLNGYKTIRLIANWGDIVNDELMGFTVGIRESGTATEFNSVFTRNSYFYVDNLKPLQKYELLLKTVNTLGVESTGVTVFSQTLNTSAGAPSAFNIPIGGILMLGGSIPSANAGSYYICSGQLLQTGLFPDLFNVISYSFGQDGNDFRLPSGIWSQGIHQIIRVA